MSYRVDNIPLILKPFYLIYSWILALCLWLVFRFYHLITRIRIKGRENIRKFNNCIYCIWHEDLPAYFIVHTHYSSPYVWMNHPVWYMKPIHIVLKLMGTSHIVLGSSGHSGKEALSGVIHYLKKGYNTVVATDGPAGPAKKVKDGVLQMGRKTGLPIIAIRFYYGKHFHLSTWDQKKFPSLFSSITIDYSRPVFMHNDNLDYAREELTNLLNKHDEEHHKNKAPAK